MHNKTHTEYFYSITVAWLKWMILQLTKVLFQTKLQKIPL